MKENFTKADLKNLMVVEQRNGWRGVVIDDRIYSYDGPGNGFETYLDDLTDAPFLGIKEDTYDIVKIYVAIGVESRVDGRPTMNEIADFLQNGNASNFELIWERKEKKEIKLTATERSLLDAALLLDYKYIARDEDGRLYLYEVPLDGKDEDTWTYTCAEKFVAHKDVTEATKGMFEFIKWEDDEPYSIEELLKL